DWEAPLRVQPQWMVLEPAALKAESGTTFKKLDDGSIIAEGTNPATDVYTFESSTKHKGLTAFRIETLPDQSLPQGGAGRDPDGNSVLSRFSVTIEDADKPEAVAMGRFIRVELPGEAKFLSLAEVQAFQGTENLARAGKATQSSLDYGGNPER